VDPGAAVDINVTVAGGTGVLGGWFDWNSDGDISDSGEFASFGSLSAGNHVLNLTIPAEYTSGRRYTRASACLTLPVSGGSLDAGDYLGFASGVRSRTMSGVYISRHSC